MFSQIKRGATKKPVYFIGKLIRRAKQLTGQPRMKHEGSRVPVLSWLTLIAFVAVRQSSGPIDP